MKITHKFRVIAFLIVMIVLFSQSAFAAGGPARPSAVAMVSDDVLPDQNAVLINEFLFSLYNGLVGRGVLTEPLLLSREEIWSRNFLPFASAIDQLSGGAFVTQSHLYFSDEAPYVYYGGENSNALFLNFRSPDQTFPFGYRSGIPAEGCHIQSIDFNTEKLASKIGHNVQCMYIQFLTNTYRSLSQPKPVFNYDYVINQSGVRVFLVSYLEELRMNGVLVSYSLNFENDSFELEVPANADGDQKVKILLTPNMVNVHSAQEEALMSEEALRELSRDAMVYVAHNELGGQAAFSTALLKAALQQVIAVSSDASAHEKEITFFRMYDIQNNLGSNTIVTEPCTVLNDIDHIYPAPDPSSNLYYVYTPYNPCVTYYRGFDNFGNRAALFTSQMLMRLVDPIKSAFPEYKVTKLASRGGQKIPGSEVLDAKNFANAFKIAQSIFIDAHGRPDGSQALMCLNLDYAGVGCCEAVKSLAKEFGIDTSTMNCRRYPVDTKDPAGIFESISSGDGVGCEGPATIYDERCIIQMHSGIWNYAGAKAVTVSSQCYGGACNGAIPDGLNNHVRDYVAGLLNAENGAGISHDYKFLGKDITGKTLQHLICLPEGNTAEVPFCTTPPYGYDTVLDFGLRNVQQSTEVRGTNGTIGGMGGMDCLATPNPVNGFEQHCFLHMGGHPKVGIEFAPTALDAGFISNSNWFYMAYSSPVEPNTGRITIDDSSCKPRLSTDVHPEYQTLEADHASVDLTGYPLMDATLWGDPVEIQRRYGQARTASWPYKLKIKLSGVKAHNGVALDGNGTAAQKWLWPIDQSSTVSPWSNITGVAPNNDNLEIDIPCAPPIQCCMPHLETQRTGPTSCQWIQNGCECTQVTSIEDCYAVPPLHSCSNPEQRFQGEPCVNASCCDRAPAQPGSPPNPGICDAYTEEVEACPWLWCYDPNRPVPTRTNRTYHFRDWSMDQNGDQDCGKVIGHCPECGEE